VTRDCQIYGQNSKFWQFWGLYSHISVSINVKFGAGERTFGQGPLPRAKFHVYRGNVSPLQGEKPIFGLLSKNNTCIDKYFLSSSCSLRGILEEQSVVNTFANSVLTYCFIVRGRFSASVHGVDRKQGSYSG